MPLLVPLKRKPGLTISWSHDLALFEIRERGDTGSFFVARRTRVKHLLSGPTARVDYLASQYMLEKVPLNAGGLAIDCGANIGEVSRYFESHGLNVIAFEPDPSEFRALTKNLSQSSTPVQAGLWEFSGRLNLHASNDSGDSSFIPHKAGLPRVQTKIFALDDYLNQSSQHQRIIDVLKIEAEGGEPEVLKGAMRALERTRYVVADLAPERGPSKESTLPESVNLLLGLGFRVMAYSPIRSILVLKNSKDFWN